LSKRRELARASKALKKAEKIFSGFTPEQKANVEKRYGGLTAQEGACKILREMAVEKLRGYTLRHLGDDAAVVEFLAGLNEDTIEEFLEGLVEGDLVIDDAEVHAFHRKLLDDLRRDVDKLMNPTLTSLSYDAIRADFPAAQLLMAMNSLDKKTEARVAHIETFSRMLNGEDVQPGETEKAEMLWNISAIGTMVTAHDEHGMGVEDIADALGVEPSTVTEALDKLAEDGLRKAG
jgi:DNA-binding transcriptional ArsR family regulator